MPTFSRESAFIQKSRHEATLLCQMIYNVHIIIVWCLFSLQAIIWNPQTCLSFSGSNFHGLSCRVTLFTASVSFKNRKIKASDWQLEKFQPVKRGFLEPTLGTKRITPHEWLCKTWASYKCFCLRLLLLLARYQSSWTSSSGQLLTAPDRKKYKKGAPPSPLNKCFWNEAISKKTSDVIFVSVGW